MNDLKQNLKVTLANAFALYLKAQFFHWNVRGADFYQYHGFFGDFYSEVYESIDNIAELIRTLDELAPGSLSRFSELATIKDANAMPPAEQAFAALTEDNQKMLDTLTTTYEMAEKYKQYGVSNYLQDRIQAHKKHAWMLKSIIARV